MIIGVGAHSRTRALTVSDALHGAAEAIMAEVRWARLSLFVVADDAPIRRAGQCPPVGLTEIPAVNEGMGHSTDNDTCS